MSEIWWLLSLLCMIWRLDWSTIRNSNIGHTLSDRARPTAACSSRVWWDMMPSALPIGSRRSPSKNVLGEVLFTTGGSLGSNFPNPTIMWRRDRHHVGDCATFWRDVPHFLGDPRCADSVGRWSEAFQHATEAKEGRTSALNTLCKSLFLFPGGKYDRKRAKWWW